MLGRSLGPIRWLFVLNTSQYIVSGLATSGKLEFGDLAKSKMTFGSPNASLELLRVV